MLCEKCHEREATCHTTTILGSVQKSTDLCNECFGASAPPDAREAANALRAAHCKYCGSQPCAGGTDMLALLTGQHRMSFMCLPCSMEFHRFMQQESRRMPHDSSQQAQLAAIGALQEAADKHMKEWISQRGTQ
jgi:protein-arginine kinase activator protein McsA